MWISTATESDQKRPISTIPQVDMTQNELLKQLAFERRLRAKCGPGDDKSTTGTMTMIEHSKPKRDTTALIPDCTRINSHVKSKLASNESLKDLAMMRQARSSQNLPDLKKEWSDVCVKRATIEHDSRKRKHQEHFEDIGLFDSEDENTDDEVLFDEDRETDRVISREECAQILDELEGFVLQQGLPKPFARLAVAKSRGNKEW